MNLHSLEKMFDDLGHQRWAISKNIFSLQMTQQLNIECLKKYENGHFKKASFGHQATHTQDSQVRGDFTAWIEENPPPGVEADFVQLLTQIQSLLNQYFFMSLKRFESHFALYPPESKYDKHIDNHRGLSARKMTFILYLNPNWQPEHGGELSIFDPEDQNRVVAKVPPEFGAFVLFRSDLFPHQVEKSFQPRLSLTGWFRDDAL